MLYQRSRDIERRLRELLDLIRTGRHSTPTLSKVLKISAPTVSRSLTALRERRYSIRAIKDDDGWWYQVVGEPAVVGGGQGESA